MDRKAEFQLNYKSFEIARANNFSGNNDDGSSDAIPSASRSVTVVSDDWEHNVWYFIYFLLYFFAK